MTSPAPITIGVDPGGRWTGLVAVNGRALIAAHVVTRHADNKIGDHGAGLRRWTDDVLTAILELAAVAVAGHALAGIGAPTSNVAANIDAGLLAIAVEGVTAPNPHQRRTDGNALTNVDGILATAHVVGAITTAWPTAIIVAPGGHGSHLAGSYPEPIRPVSAAGKDRNRHARSAYDVAIAAAFLGRIANAERVAADAAWPSTVTDAVTTHR